MTTVSPFSCRQGITLQIYRTVLLHSCRKNPALLKVSCCMVFLQIPLINRAMLRAVTLLLQNVTNLSAWQDTKPQRHWTFPETSLAACLWELLQIIYSQRKTGLTWHGSQERLQSYIIWGIRVSSELKGSKWPAVVMAIVTSQTWLQVSSKRRRGAMRRRQGLPLLKLRGFLLVSHCFIPCGGALARDKPSQLPGAQALAGISSSYSALSLLPAVCSMPKLASALRGAFPLLAGLNQLTSSFGFSKITPLPGNLHLRFCRSDSLSSSISLNMHDPRGSHSCNLLMRIK